ncbi:MAG: hypothetical protein E7393_02300 [Ruminococcaceae bacterium]|nr:hypothetical protein [Oscillospiraceae bacterium]
MFGYINIDKEELKVREYNLFKAHYCGLCQTIKEEYGFPARYFLSYDAVFLALMLLSVSAEEPTFVPIRCMANPMVKRPSAQKNSCLSYGAAVNVLLVWFKLKDDWQDYHSIKAGLLMPFMIGKKRKAQKKYPGLYHSINIQLQALQALEKARCANPDEVADVFGSLIAKVMEVDFIENTETRRILSHIGYLVGRFIYLLDAWEDRASDEKKKAYNPYLLAHEYNEEDSKLSLEYTLSQLGNSLQLLGQVRNSSILENIIYLGLKNALDRVFSGRETAACGIKEKRHERPL